MGDTRGREADHRRFEGGCHRGNIRFTFDRPAAAATMPARAGGCMFCRKHGVAWP